MPVDETVQTVDTTSDTGTDAGSDVGTDIPSEYADLSLDDLLNADFSDDPILGQEHKGLPAYGDILKHLPENGRKLIANLRSMATKKTQELATARVQLEAERAAVQREKEALYSGQFARDIASKAAEDVSDIDLYDEAGLAKRIEIESAKKLQEMLRPVQNELETQKRQAQLESFKRENPDLISPEIKGEVAKLLVSRPELKLEDAYYIVKAKVNETKLKQVEAERKNLKGSQRDALLRTSGGSNVSDTKPPKGMSAWEAYQFHQSRQADSKKR